MKKAISILLVLVICLSVTVTAFATNNGQQGDFVSSPGEGGSACNHAHTVGNQKKDPTCTEDGYYGREICQDCGEVVKPGTTVPSKGHDYKDEVCTICGAHYEPTTGDISLALWIGLMAFAAVSLVVVTVVYRKKA